MSAQGAAGAGEAVQTTSTPAQPADNAQQTTDHGQGEEQTPLRAVGSTEPEAPFGTRLGAVLEEMDLPDDVRAIFKPKAPKTTGETPVLQGEAQGQQSQQRPEGGPAPTTQPAQQPAAEQEHPVPEEWPDSAKQRVAEESGKRRKRTEELDAARRRIAELESTQRPEGGPSPTAQQPAAARPTPSEEDPLADVTNEQELGAALREYDDLYAWAEMNHDGLQDVLLGKDANGNEIRHDYSAQEMARIRIKCQRILNRDIPARVRYLEAQRAVEQEARQARPELFDPQSPVHQEAQLILRQLPEIRRFPDWQIWIGDAIAGRNAREQAAAGNGNGNNAQRPTPNAQRPTQHSPTVQAFLRPQPPMAPTPPTVRGGAPLTGANDVDLNKAREELVESGGTNEAMEQFIARSRQAQSQRLGGRQPALV